MKITEKQLLVMLAVLKDSLRVIGGVAGFDEKILSGVYNEIMNQQSDDLKDVE